MPAANHSLPSPEAQAANLAALHALDLLDTDPEVAFDAVANVAARVFRAPTALVSLVDEQRQWFKSRVGMACTETPLSESFCRYAVASRVPTVVLDATEDPIFCDNPLVTAPQGLRFYAGAPLLLAGGAAIGTVCVLDYAPRSGCNPADLAVLTDLACIAVETIVLRAAASGLIRERPCLPQTV
ncbi:GAF domain-containing protein [Jannaschia seohaensis]|uniref:GAF domain-containing protein n=1 Tax=Jannaschia seohaensis TaxID=475081 RepID=A0A2Y9A680_9RHOB|nr:GAF domain-containing protein [Jannaschia seohaensis]PWJ21831.1 GAF domain-containing protein [Jannaschia seohaensis]SSA38109.1 GAF domain-containing protein [Jannaschia seohaensis]